MHLIGLGAAGSSLVEALATFERLPGEVVISDPAPESIRDKGYGFWCRTNDLNRFKPDSVWNSWSFSSMGERVTHTGHKFLYGYRSGQSIFENVASILSTHPQIHLVKEAVRQSPNADFVFDSRPVSPQRYIVNQAFYGLLIKTNAPHPFNSVQLMEDLNSDERGVNFRYLLPFDDTHLLIEHTEFTGEVPDFQSLKLRVLTWCETHIGSDYEVLKVEQANIPMGLTGSQPSLGTPIGVRGGRMRDSSGYSYYYAINDAYRIAHSLVWGVESYSLQPNYAQSWMDAKLLWLIRRRPERLPKIFLSLARRMTDDRFASFMSQNTPSDSLRAIMASPKLPFLRSVLGDF